MFRKSFFQMEKAKHWSSENPSVQVNLKVRFKTQVLIKNQPTPKCATNNSKYFYKRDHLP